MSRQADPDILARNEEIVAVFEENKLENIPHLAATYGLSSAAIRKILKSAGVDVVGRVSQGPPPMIMENAISRRHSRIGQIISDIRTFQMKIAPREFAKRANVSSMKLARGEFGCYDWTISELARVAEALGLPFHELVNPKEASPYEQPDVGATREKILGLHLPVPEGGVASVNSAPLRND